MRETGFLIDVDRVVYRGDRAIPAAIAFLDAIRNYHYPLDTPLPDLMVDSPVELDLAQLRSMALGDTI
jgi:hypothetical protein